MGNCEEELPKKPVGRLSVNCRPTVGRQLVVCRPTGFARNIGYLLVLNLSVTCWLAVGRLSVTCRPTGFLGSSSSQLPIHGNMESICQIYTTINFMLIFTNNTPFHHYIGKTKTTIISYTWYLTHIVV